MSLTLTSETTLEKRLLPAPIGHTTASALLSEANVADAPSARATNDTNAAKPPVPLCVRALATIICTAAAASSPIN